MPSPAVPKTGGSLPRVKVIVPCYDYAKYLEGCVESVLAQEGVDVRVLIVDDCSPDDTPAVAARLAARDERVEYRRHERNLGLIATANEGLAWAEDAEYAVIISADDMLTPGSLQRAASVMEANPRVGLVYGRAVQFANGETPPRPGHWQGIKVWSGGEWVRLPFWSPGRWRGTKVWRGEDWIRRRCRSGYGCISSPEAVVRVSAQRRAGSYDPDAHHMAEVNMWLRVAAISDVAYVKGAAQALYRIHTSSMSRTMQAGGDGPIIDLENRRAAFAGFFAAAGSRLPDAARLEALARRTIARQALWQASRAYDRGQVEGPGVVSAAQFEAFALETYPQARRLREWRGLRLRQRIGAGRSLWFPPFLATGAVHRMRVHYDRLRLHAQGI
jgi:glycosyl transferase family 2